jgi:hypothetical protein
MAEARGLPRVLLTETLEEVVGESRFAAWREEARTHRQEPAV